MPKLKIQFYCQNCGTSYAKWQGQCTACKSWNTIVEELVQKEKSEPWQESIGNSEAISKPLKVTDIDVTQEKRIILDDEELNRALGGGLVLGSLILLGGEPGIGKSTLLLQAALNIKSKTLYVSGEESQKQIKLRAERIQSKNDNCFILTETKTQVVFKHITSVKPQIIIIDSIQTLQSEYIESSAGSISQIKQCTSELIKFAKETNTPVFIIGHITKDGHIAGPKILEHMVDTVLHFEGDRNHLFRLLRVKKNRFGSTNEMGIYEMDGQGLKEVKNPSAILVSKKDEALSGNVIAAALESTRPLMIEVQALVSTAVYGTPQRSATGFNAKRLNMLLAVLEKKAGFRLGAKDVFLNITGGISIDDPAIDLAVITAILSSNEDIVLSNDFCFAAEIGLSGEIRPVQRIEQRIMEAEKLGFSDIFISKYNKLNNKPFKINIVKISKIEELINTLF